MSTSKGAPEHQCEPSKFDFEYHQNRIYLYRMLLSTDRRSGIEPVYGAPGVDSSINRPYSGWNFGTETLQRGPRSKSKISGLGDGTAKDAYFSGQSAHMPSTIEPSLANISVCLNDSFAFFSLSSKEMTMYSTCDGSKSWEVNVVVAGTHLITPQQFVALSVLQPIPYVQKLGNSMAPNVVGILLSFVPNQRRSKIQQSHVGEKRRWRFSNCDR